MTYSAGPSGPARVRGVDRPGRLPTIAEAALGAVASVIVAAVLFWAGSPAGVAPLVFGLVLLGYAALKAIGWLVGRIIG